MGHHLVLTVKALWLFVCLCGNLYQIEVIMKNYFQFETITNVDVSFPKFLIAPSLGMCFQKVDLIKWDELIKIKPDIKENLNFTDMEDYAIMEEMRGTALIKKIGLDAKIFGGLDDASIFKITRDFKDLIGECKVVDNEKMEIEDVPCDKVIDVQTYINKIYKCSALVPKINITYNYLRSSRLLTIPNFLYQLIFTPLMINITNGFTVMFNEKSQVNRDGHLRFIFLSHLQQLFSVTYEEYETVLLPKPYNTDCLNFGEFWKEDWVIDSGTCFDLCLRNNVAKKIGQNRKLPGQYGFQNTSKEENVPKFITVGEMLVSEKLKHATCDSPACNHIFYVPKLQTALEYPLGSLLIYILQSPKTTIVSSPKLPTIQCVTDVASTFGFWIGISVYSIMDYFELIWTTMKKKITKVSTNVYPKQNMYQEQNDNAIRTSSRSLRAANNAYIHNLMSLNYDRCLSRDNWPRNIPRVRRKEINENIYH